MLGQHRRLRKFAIAGLILAGAYAAGCAGFFWVMRQPPSDFGRIMARVPMPLMIVFPFEPMWNVARGGELEPGQPAPDFALPLRDKGGIVRLSDFRGSKPVALIFGSYT